MYNQTSARVRVNGTPSEIFILKRAARQDQIGEEHKILLYADNVMVSNRSEKHLC